MIPRPVVGVIHVSLQFPPHASGGLGTLVLALSRAQAPRLPVAVLVPADPRYPTLTGVRYWMQVGDPRDPEVAREWAGTLVQAIEAFRRPGNRLPVVHAHNYEVALPVLRACAATGAPLAVTLHLPAPASLAHLERDLLEHADAVVAVSRALADEYRAKSWRMVALDVIPNGVDSRFFFPDPRVMREPHRLLLAGRLTPQKGVDVALRALAQLLPAVPELSLRIAGTGPWERAYRNLSRRLGLADRVSWLGFVSPEQVREEYRHCGMLLMPSRAEPFGLSALEAMACGTPVIASRAGGLPEFISHAETGLLAAPGDPAALAEAVRSLLRTPAEADRLGSAAAAAALHWSWDRAAGSTLAVYARAELHRELR